MQLYSLALGMTHSMVMLGNVFDFFFFMIMFQQMGYWKNMLSLKQFGLIPALSLC